MFFIEKEKILVFWNTCILEFSFQYVLDFSATSRVNAIFFMTIAIYSHSDEKNNFIRTFLKTVITRLSQ